jgi:glucan phosphoethanolaminetransferase (alkaline phosphatase superfamily)
MNKPIAHIVILFFDLAAMGCCYFVFYEFNFIKEQISASAEVITYQNIFGLYALTIMVPVIHVTALIKWGRAVKKKWGNFFLVSAFVLLLISVFIFNLLVKNMIIESGYRYCPEKSQQMSFSTFKTYIKDTHPCIKSVN